MTWAGGGGTACRAACRAMSVSVRRQAWWPKRPRFYTCECPRAALRLTRCVLSANSRRDSSSSASTSCIASAIAS